MDKDKFRIYIDLKWSNQRTADEYRHLARRIEAYWEGDKVTQNTINNFQAELLASCHTGRLNSLPMAFLKHYIQCYEEDCEDAGMRRLKLIRPASRMLQRATRYKFLTKEEINSLLRSITDPYLKVVIRLMFETGLRVSEIANIRDKDIDYKTRTITGIGKGNKEFKVRFSMTSYDNLILWQRRPHHNVDYPFRLFFGHVAPKEHKNQRAAIWKLFAAHLKEIHFPKHVSPHQIRHSFGTYLRRDLGLDLMQIKTAMRHASVNSTQIYVPATDEEVADILEKKMLNRDRKV